MPLFLGNIYRINVNFTLHKAATTLTARTDESKLLESSRSGAGMIYLRAVSLTEYIGTVFFAHRLAVFISLITSAF